MKSSLFSLLTFLFVAVVVGNPDAPTHSNPWLAAELEGSNSLTSHGYNETIVGYWKLNRYGSSDESKVLDETGINNGTPTNFDNTSLSGPTYEGRIGGAWNFDGVDDYVTTPDSLNLTNTGFTFSTWIYSVDLSTDYSQQTIIGRVGVDIYREFNWRSTDKTIHFYIGGSTDGVNALRDSPSTIKVNEWHHMAMTFNPNNNNETIIYTDGIYQKSENLTSPSSNWGQILIGGTRNSPSTRIFNGTIDEVAIYNVSLSADEILNLYLDGLVNKSETVYTTQDLGASSNNTADVDNDNLTSIFNWYEDNVSLAVLNMPFDSNNSNSTGSTKDYSSRGNHGTVINATWNATGGIDKDIPGVFSGAYEFDGDGDYVELGVADLNTSEPYTISLWYYNLVHGATLNQEIISKARGSYYFAEINLRTYTEDRLHLIMGNGVDGYWLSSSSDLIYDINTWYHVTITNDGTNIRLYKNAVLDKTFTPTNYYTTSITNFSIGRRGDINNGYFNGTIDEVQIYNRSLSAEEIKQLYLKNYGSLVSEETTKDKCYKSEIYINDGTDDSSGLNTTEICILNSPPYFSPALSAQTAQSGDETNVTISCSDADSDTLTYYENFTGSGISNYSLFDSSGIFQFRTSYWEYINQPFNIQAECVDSDGESSGNSTFSLGITTCESIRLRHVRLRC